MFILANRVESRRNLLYNNFERAARFCACVSQALTKMVETLALVMQAFAPLVFHEIPHNELSHAKF